MLIELHVLRNHSAANLNRDDTGRPKTQIFGGVERSRVSSQNRKFTWRHSSIFRETAQAPISIRTTLLPAIVAELVTSDVDVLKPGLTAEQRDAIIDAVAIGIMSSFGTAKSSVVPSVNMNDPLGKAAKGKKGKKTEEESKEETGDADKADKKDKESKATTRTAITPTGDGRQYGREEVELVLNKIIRDDFRTLTKPGLGDDKNKPKTGQVMALSIADIIQVANATRAMFVDALARPTLQDTIVMLDTSTIRSLCRPQVGNAIPPDVALFGRMITDPAFADIDGACQVAHTLGVAPVQPELDFWTATDDINKHTSGAGGMGSAQFNSACFYEYANLDFDHLLENFGGDRELAISTTKAFLLAAILEVSKSMQNSFASFALPATVLVTINNRKIPISLANAFESPIMESDAGAISTLATKALFDQLEKSLDTFFPTAREDRSIRCLGINTTPAETSKRVWGFSDIDQLIDSVLSSL